MRIRLQPVAIARRTHATRQRSAALPLVLFVATLCACRETAAPQPYTYAVPPQDGDGWVTAAPGDVGMDQAPLVALMNELRSRDHGLNGILVARHGRLVFEEYFPGQQVDLEAEDPRPRVDVAFDRSTPHYMASASKSVTSALVGIAIDRGLITGVGAKLFSFFPDYADLNDTQKSGITLAHLLTMRSGWSWSDDDIDADQSDEVQMFFSQDPLRFLLERPLARPPDTHMDYNSGNTVLLGEIVRRTSGMDLHAFARQYLFGPLGIDTSRWAHCRNAAAVAFAGGGLYMRPRDMAKIGQLYLHDGVWNGNVVISQQWVRQSVQNAFVSWDQFSDHYMHTGYGYQWWPGRWDSGATTFLAAGWGGQFIMVVPSLDLVIVITGDYYDVNSMEGPVGAGIFDDILHDHILAAVR